MWLAVVQPGGCKPCQRSWHAMLCALAQQLPSARDQERFCEDVVQVQVLLHGLSDIHGIVTMDRQAFLEVQRSCCYEVLEALQVRWLCAPPAF